MEYFFSKAAFAKQWLLTLLFLSICSPDSAAYQVPALPEAETTGQVDTATPEALPQASSSPAVESSSQPPSPRIDTGKSNSQKQARGTSKDRLFFALPNFLTLENAANVPALTAAQKFKIVTSSSFDYFEYFWYGALAGIRQAENSQADYGQGAEGYGKRYGAAFADGTLENYMTRAVLPSLLHQDPRYFQSGKGGFWHRTGYAVSRIFVTRSDSGQSQFNYSEIFGSAIGAGISTFTYHPRDDRNVGNALGVWGSQIAYDTLTIVVKEFWPDIRHRLHKTK